MDIVCERSDVYASACAVARAFPLYSKKSSVSNGTEVTNVSVEFVIMSNGRENNHVESIELTPQELSALDEAATGIRLAARIVDTPCNEMNVDHFLEVIK
ncbi:hypothetical protein NQ314_013318 [Rhamnusium bicolor]|uniref:Uncharacterized protein n=1 Tax=Rhamnusium bicolor TaxID=1586634 RepID=A0AAV8X787_9CUCU|nr:hypothetical protein NQ314_013318 [Rhamnusium bicolor]